MQAFTNLSMLPELLRNLNSQAHQAHPSLTQEPCLREASQTFHMGHRFQQEVCTDDELKHLQGAGITKTTISAWFRAANCWPICILTFKSFQHMCLLFRLGLWNSSSQIHGLRSIAQHRHQSASWFPDHSRSLEFILSLNAVRIIAIKFNIAVVTNMTRHLQTAHQVKLSWADTE
jgi:hypothetical protein